ncbi:MAG: cupin domain-containing protein [Bacteroidetes bacterium]|nr:cupin domain-containing protein [Bacteroidota bacterium]
MNKLTIERISPAQFAQMGIRKWPVWEKEIADFPWHYDETESCYILEGEVDIVTSEGTFSFGPDDFVTFHKGLDCRWIIRKAVKKHYKFF